MTAVKNGHHSASAISTVGVHPSPSSEVAGGVLTVSDYCHSNSLGSSNDDFSSQEEEEEYEEYDDFSELPDTRSIASDDSFYPPDSVSLVDEDRASTPQSPTPLTLFQACSSNNALLVKVMIRQGLSEREVRETDKNSRTCLIMACYQGFVDVVTALSQCPFVDVNWQDKEGNTALIMAAQAGHITITNYLLNYFPGLELEKRNVHGFTALMKAAMQGRTECVRALMLAGADIHAFDPNRHLTPHGWAQFTGRYETICIMQKLLKKPCPVQIGDAYKPEWPKLKELLAKANEPKSCLDRICEHMRSFFAIKFPHDPEDDGVFDHMVRMTTGLSSPFVATACNTVCPSSPPCVGKRRYAVQEILARKRAKDIKSQTHYFKRDYQKLFQNSQMLIVTKKQDRRASLQLQRVSSPELNVSCSRRVSMLPLNVFRRSSIRPGFIIPKVRIIKAPATNYQPERVRRNSSMRDSDHLQIPKWRYKELKEEKRRAAQEEERRKAMQAAKQKQQSFPKK
ncbi:ankyrin repeat domain-containing protein 33B [Protopterus annectens]|uniref:ankyrin repeat domain-containing protein 33B n=1 Tax=Protopterus annectens TaxID=7888 RepID=UPI001CFBCF38|nr:ankyrin repeat domain-containing protein 33B [Protopterus annectens]